MASDGCSSTPDSQGTPLDDCSASSSAVSLPSTLTALAHLCCCKDRKLLYSFLQDGHANGNSSECCTMWRSKNFALLTTLPHTLHVLSSKSLLLGDALDLTNFLVPLFDVLLTCPFPVFLHCDRYRFILSPRFFRTGLSPNTKSGSSSCSFALLWILKSSS